MNETNHNRVICKFAELVNISKTDVDILKAASAFTDSINAEWKYFFYHFYYDINVCGNFLQLKRVDENTNKSSNSINRCGDHGYLSHPIDELAYFMLSKLNEKEFFSTLVNERPRSLRHDLGDFGNQSDNVAFLHAMGASGESKGKSQEVFENHLKKCFAEFLFLEHPKSALFILGIAFHGIMDSFTPSHMDFQKYTEQDWGLHAQGDVIPFRGDDVIFDPGQITKAKPEEVFLAVTSKGYNGNDHINDKEFEMFNIFAEIGNIATNETIRLISERKINLSSTKTIKTAEKVELFSLHRLNTILEENKVKYNENSFVYSDAAIDVCKQVYVYLREIKMQINNDYKKYKDMINNEIPQKALNLWIERYKTFLTNDTLVKTNIFNKK